MPASYEKALIWIIRERIDPIHLPDDLSKVSGWLLTRLVADLFDRPVAMVAADIIEYARHLHRPKKRAV